MATVTIRKEIEVEVYRMECSKCGDGLEFTVDADRDGDLTMDVEPCETCLKAAREDARRDA